MEAILRRGFFFSSNALTFVVSFKNLTKKRKGAKKRQTFSRWKMQDLFLAATRIVRRNLTINNSVTSWAASIKEKAYFALMSVKLATSLA